jgi:hypothetical protein
MAPQVALAASKSTFTLCAMAIPLTSGDFVTCTDAMRTAVAHAPLTVESNVTSFGALALDITLIVLTIFRA